MTDKMIKEQVHREKWTVHLITKCERATENWYIYYVLFPLYFQSQYLKKKMVAPISQLSSVFSFAISINH